jgi:hypothetical protein
MINSACAGAIGRSWKRGRISLHAKGHLDTFGTFLATSTCTLLSDGINTISPRENHKGIVHIVSYSACFVYKSLHVSKHCQMPRGPFLHISFFSLIQSK